MPTELLEIEPNTAWGELRQQAHYWKAQHSRAVEREAFWKQKALQLEKVVHHQNTQIEELTKQVENLKNTGYLVPTTTIRAKKRSLEYQFLW